MKAKILKHKTLPDTYGIFCQVDDKAEIGHRSIPELLPMTFTLEAFKAIQGADHEPAMQQIDDYDVVEVNITMSESYMEIPTSAETLDYILQCGDLTKPIAREVAIAAIEQKAALEATAALKTGELKRFTLAAYVDSASKSINDFSIKSPEDWHEDWWNRKFPMADLSRNGTK